LQVPSLELCEDGKLFDLAVTDELLPESVKKGDIQQKDSELEKYFPNTWVTTLML
jgi:hypothetical protein